MGKAKINLTGAGYGEIEVNGFDVSNACRALTLTAQAGEIIDLELHLNIVQQVEVHGDDVDIRLFMPEDTKQALIALGWTPPRDETPEESLDS